MSLLFFLGEGDVPGAAREGMAELAGIPGPVLAHFSKRRAAIVEAAEGSGRTARQKAALDTRPVKEDVELGILVADWRAAAAEIGFASAELERLEGRVSSAASLPARRWTGWAPGSPASGA